MNSFFGTTFNCTCGRRHEILPRRIVLADDAIDQMPAICADTTTGRRAAVLMDVRTQTVAGAGVSAALAGAGWAVQKIVISDGAGGSSPVCDDLTYKKLLSQVNPADLVIPVGSGVICDLGKWLVYERSVPFIPFATAASMNGYSSANVAPTIDGVKTLLRAEAPPAVVSSLKILSDAPYEMTAAGLGDILAKSASSADWFLNSALFGDYYCQRCVDLIADIEPLYLDRPGDLRWRRAETVVALFRALLLTGAAMTMAGSSAPASGGEHMISHSLDAMSSLDGAPHDLHGRQVGVGTVICSELYRRVLAVESPDCVSPCRNVDAKFWGRLSGAVAGLYEQKVPRLVEASEKLNADKRLWDNLRAKLATMLHPPEVIRHCLATAGAAAGASDIGCDKKRLMSAFVHAHEIRTRFTVLDLAGLLGLMPAAAEEIIDRWA